ncbi:MAG TPA: MerR family transcriptional regulator [Candidatus Latescibacteria bacterium]|nr:MerR family transcriptional regulator [Candidatus Latescibacterota bacterium]
MLKRRFTRLYWRIGEVAEITGISQQTLRAWEQELAILRPRRDASGVRVYRERDFRIVLVLQQLIEKEKWSVSDVKELLVAAPDEIRTMINAVPPEALEGTPEENEPSTATRTVEKPGVAAPSREPENEEPGQAGVPLAEAAASRDAEQDVPRAKAEEPGSVGSEAVEPPAVDATAYLPAETEEPELADKSLPVPPLAEEPSTVVHAAEAGETAEPVSSEMSIEEHALPAEGVPETEETWQDTGIPASATGTHGEPESEPVEAPSAAEPVVEPSDGDINLVASAPPTEGEGLEPVEAEDATPGVPVAADLMEQSVSPADEIAAAEDVSPTADVGYHPEEEGREQVLAATKQNEPSTCGEETTEETAGEPTPGEAKEENGMATPVSLPVEEKGEASSQEEARTAALREVSLLASESQREPEFEESGEEERLNQPGLPEVAAEESEPSAAVQPWDGVPVTAVAETPPSTSVPEPEPLPSATAITWEAESEIPAEAAETAAQIAEGVSVQAPENEGADKTRDAVANMAFPQEQPEHAPETRAPSVASAAHETVPRAADIEEETAASTFVAMPTQTGTELRADGEIEPPLPERREVFELIASEAAPVPETLPKSVVEELRALREELAAIAEIVRMLVDPSPETTDAATDASGERALAACSSGDEKSPDA